jgi:chitodextrinase
VGYIIYRGGTQIGTSATTTYTDTTTVGMTLYSYTVASYDNATPPNVSAPSAAWSVTTPAPNAPSTPTGLTTVSATSTQVVLSWTASTDTGGPGLAGYRIYRGGTQIGTSTSTTYTDATTSGTTTYSYTVAAVDIEGVLSGQSTALSVTTPDTIPPSVPTGLTKVSATSTQVVLSWTASTDTGGSGLASYRIYRGGTQIGTSTSTTYTDATTSGTTTYSYTVASVDNAGNVSAQSAPLSVTTPDTIPPSVPTGLVSTSQTISQVVLSWTASTDTGGSGLSGYRIYRGGTQIGTSTGTTYTDATVAASTTYSYTVASVDNAGNVSSQSAPLSVTTPSAIPAVPTNLHPKGTVTNSPWTEGWNASDSSTAYYNLSIDDGTGPVVHKITAPTTSYTMGGTNGTTYYIQVQACNSSNQCSAYTAVSLTYCSGGVCP